MDPIYSSFGSLIIDDIQFQDGTKKVDIPGGGGIFAIIGMRIFLNSKNASSIGYVAHCGFDHPKIMDEALESLDISIKNITHQDKHTTRGLNTFSENDHRDFEYIHPIIRITPTDFPDHWIQSLQLVHLICSTERTIEIVKVWREREKELSKSSHTKFLWEPLPWACLPENYPNIKEAGQYVDIISPNHEEVITFLGLATTNLDNSENNSNDINNEIKNPTISETDASKTKSLIEKCGQQLRKDFPHATIVIRSGKLGASVTDPSMKEDEMKWIPAYWSVKDKDHIVDPTGCGNAFCGGFMIGFLESNGDPILSAMYGSVASSFVLEQVGLPQLLIDDHGNENWNNGPSPSERLKQLQLRCL
ncbi:unnamed protein product [Cunninghamella blakesleeana]